MESKAASCPAWLAHYLKQAGGAVPFREFMDWALNDPEHGYYGSGRARLGPAGDFATSPSLGFDFAALLARQIAAWVPLFPNAACLSLVEFGPGEGDLAADLIAALQELVPDSSERFELVLIEANPGMRDRQQRRLLETSSIPIRWSTADQLQSDPVVGFVLAHEFFDALPVDRLIWLKGSLQLQGICLSGDQSLETTALPLPSALKSSIDEICARCGFVLPPEEAQDGWATEWHSDQAHWFKVMANGLRQGALLVIDYSLEARRYYSSRRSDGTLMGYRHQQAINAPLEQIGAQDLTAHLCIDTAIDAAEHSGWRSIDCLRQGEALLALGLAERLHGLQSLAPDQLPLALNRREAMLRLVDPAGLGDFRWMLFGRNLGEVDLRLAGSPNISRSPLG